MTTLPQSDTVHTASLVELELRQMPVALRRSRVRIHVRFHHLADALQIPRSGQYRADGLAVCQAELSARAMARGSGSFNFLLSHEKNCMNISGTVELTLAKDLYITRFAAKNIY